MIGAGPHERTEARSNQRNGSLAAHAVDDRRGVWSGGFPKLGTGPFFPALLAVTFYSGAGPAVLGWLFAICAAAVTWGGSMVRPVLAVSDRWALAAFALSTALSIAIGARARQAALEERSQLLRVEEQAQHDVNRAEENKHLALSKLSHDLRTPLSTIIGWAQVLRAQNPPEQMLHGLEVIERNARTQTRIISELLDGRQAPEDDVARGNGPGPVSP